MRAALIRIALLLLDVLVVGACRSEPAPVSSAVSDASALASGNGNGNGSGSGSGNGSADGSAAPSPLPRLPVSPESARRGEAFAKQAERCFDEPRCSADEAARLYLAADDAGALSVSCFRFYYGIGVPAEAARARACFERMVREEVDHAGSSPSLERVFLGLMLLDGQGGTRDVERGKALFVDCYLGNDSGVSAAAEKRAAAGSSKPIDFCADIGGTTLDMNACAEVERERSVIAAQLEVKAIVAELALDEAGLTLWKKAERAWHVYASHDADYVGDKYRGGSMRIAQTTWALAGHERERAAVLRGLLDRKAAPAKAEAEEELKREEARVLAGALDAANKKLLAASQASWKVYRAAEVAFVRRAFGKRYGSEAAAVRALEAELASRRAADLHGAVEGSDGE